MDEDKQALLDALAFVGESLAPFFLEDPWTGQIKKEFEALASLDVIEAAHEWPFVQDQQAQLGLTLMHDGLQNGLDDALVWEYRRLFIGPDTKPAPPWGSVYTDREMVVFGQSTLVLRAWMRTHAIVRLTDEKTPEDHIGLMLMLMAWIARNRAELLEEFLRVHLLTWSSHFLEELSAAAQHPFYEGLARLAQASLEGIQQVLSLKVDYPRFYR